MSENLIEVKLPIGPVTVSVDGLMRKLFGRVKKGNTEIVAERFLGLFGAHGVAATQIPRFIPEIGLDKLNSKEALLGSLTGPILNRTAELFGVRLEWLEGDGEEVYPYRSCYKTPVSFFEDLSQIKDDGSGFPVCALFCPDERGAARSAPRSLVLLLVEKIADMGDKSLSRYHVYTDEMPWDHLPARIQVKAMIRVYHLSAHKPVPLYRVSPKTLEAVSEGKMVPHGCLRYSVMTEPSLEDFALSTEESCKAKECVELPMVLEYIERMELNKAADFLDGRRKRKRRK